MGFLRCLSDGCHGTDYVPFYGAESFSHSEDSILNSLKNHFGIAQFSLKHHRKLNNLRQYQENEWEKYLESLLKKWVDNKYFSGRLNELEGKFFNFREVYKEDLIEQILLLAGPDFETFSAHLQHEDYEYDCEIFGFVGKQNAFYLHFSFSD